MSVDTQDMEIVHRVLRRESRRLMELVAAVTPGDTARAKVIAEHFRSRPSTSRNRSGPPWATTW
ncbi:hypothetical protein [Streptosporangium sp. NBC_01756]|uniref:hypothetical protein n=1 Tax=Streptosporangium sp. NBC_01756 TaxID=2975950 RepID=UPI002DD80191|nr:hypothetical protein [Streptosporangium sp. NBC_01756]WSC86523.1 hypothetical protein OIE48_40305 [Streptosporangium sp. NBC_01756]